MQSINTQRTNADSFCFSAKPFTMMGPVHILLRMRDRILAQNIYSKKGKIIIIYFYLYTCIFVYLYICILNRKLVFVYLYICTLHNYAVHCLKCSLKFHCPNKHIFLFVYLYICIFVYLYTCICILVFVYLYICTLPNYVSLPPLSPQYPPSLLRLRTCLTMVNSFALRKGEQVFFSRCYYSMNVIQ